MFWGKKRKVYLDHAASTPLRKKVYKAMSPYFFDIYANPSSLYKSAICSKKAIEKSRKIIAGEISANPTSIIFTSGGTESNNLALLGFARANKSIGRHIITTRIEHTSVLEPIKRLEEEGFEITYVEVEEDGRVLADNIIKEIREDTILVSIMHSNNEIGTILDIPEFGRAIIKWRKENSSNYPALHTDACQSMKHIDINVDKLHVDLMSMSSSKIYGPKGVGILYKRKGIKLEPISYGGGQEKGIRPGTHNTPGIVGMAKALSILKDNKKESDVIKNLRDYLWNGINSSIKNVQINGPLLNSDRRLQENLNVSFVGAESEAVILYLNSYGIEVSSGSSCSEQSGEESHVLRACGLSSERVSSAIRFTLGANTTKKDIDYCIDKLQIVISKVRGMNRGIS